jgi:hypothetical protein
MKKNPATVAELQEKFDRLRQSLAQTGPISEGSVLQRSVATSGRSGYQWTRKVAGKTVGVALSQEQYAALKAAVANQRQVRQTLKEMEQISRQIIFRTTPDTRRRKPLSQKVLGLI